MAKIDRDKISRRIESNRSILSSNQINKVYGSDLCSEVYRDEAKVVIPGNVLGETVKLKVQLITKKRIDEIRMNNSGCCHLHIGFVPVIIHSLLPSGNDSVEGECAIVESSRESFRAGLIDSFRFAFTKEKQYAAKIVMINSVIDINCDGSASSIQVMLNLKGIYRSEQRPGVAVITGITCVAMNRARMLPKLGSEKINMNICNTVKIDEADEDGNEVLMMMFEAEGIEVKADADDEEVLHGEKRSIVMRMTGRKNKPVVRRNMKV